MGAPSIKYYTAKIIDAGAHELRFYDNKKELVYSEVLASYKISEIPNIIHKLNKELKTKYKQEHSKSLFDV